MSVEQCIGVPSKFARTPIEMVGLSLHWSKTRLHPHQPFNHLPILISVVLEADLVVLVISLRQVELYRGAFKHSSLLAARLVNNSWDSSIGCIVSVWPWDGQVDMSR